MNAVDVQRLIGFDDATRERLEAYVAVLNKWQRRINLVAASTLDDVWCRHVLDSAQMNSHLPPDARRVADVGAGAGFPGLVLAILGAPDVHLIEVDQRKSAFLREVLRVTETPATLITVRAESIAGLDADVVVARACAPLNKLLKLTQNLRTVDATCLFAKGENVDAELTAALKSWNIGIERIDSVSDPRGTILKLTDIVSRHDA